MDDFHPLELDSLLHAFPSLKLKTFPQTRVIGDYNECKKFVVNTIIIMVFPSAKLVFRFRLSFNQILSPGLQPTPGFSTNIVPWPAADSWLLYEGALLALLTLSPLISLYRWFSD